MLLLYNHSFYLYQVLELCTLCNRRWIARIETLNIVSHFKIIVYNMRVTVFFL
jgi:hypothetical protein